MRRWIGRRPLGNPADSQVDLADEPSPEAHEASFVPLRSAFDVLSRAWAEPNVHGYSL